MVKHWISIVIRICPLRSDFGVVLYYGSFRQYIKMFSSLHEYWGGFDNISLPPRWPLIMVHWFKALSICCNQAKKLLITISLCSSVLILTCSFYYYHYAFKGHIFFSPSAALYKDREIKYYLLIQHLITPAFTYPRVLLFCIQFSKFY